MSQKKTITSGKRKTSKARAIITEGKGRVRINNVPIGLMEPWTAREKIAEPIRLASPSIRDRVDIRVDVKGGGYISQAEAARMSIARALVKWSKSKTLRNTYVEYDRTMLAGDERRTEPKKFGGPSARTRKQKSYR